MRVLGFPKLVLCPFPHSRRCFSFFFFAVAAGYSVVAIPTVNPSLPLLQVDCYLLDVATHPHSFKHCRNRRVGNPRHHTSSRFSTHNRDLHVPPSAPSIVNSSFRGWVSSPSSRSTVRYKGRCLSQPYD